MSQPQTWPNHCPKCGQETALHPPSVAEFARQFGGNYIAPRGALWRTLASLLFRPGHLTLEWLAGRRRRYILPLRLYLSLSVLFFFLLQLTGAPQDGSAVVVINARDGQSQTVGQSSGLDIDLGPGHWGWFEGLRPLLRARIETAKQRLAREGGDAFGRRVMRELIKALYYALFLLIPLQAAALALAFRRARRNYGEHLLFVLNRSSAMLLFMLMLLFSPWPLLSALIVLGMLINAEREMRQVYGRWARVIWRRVLLLAMQWLPLLPLLLGILLYSLLV